MSLLLGLLRGFVVLLCVSPATKVNDDSVFETIKLSRTCSIENGIIQPYRENDGIIAGQFRGKCCTYLSADPGALDRRSREYWENLVVRLNGAVNPSSDVVAHF